MKLTYIDGQDYEHEVFVKSNDTDYINFDDYTLMCKVYTTTLGEVMGELLPSPIITLLNNNYTANLNFKGSDYATLRTNRLYFKFSGIHKTTLKSDVFITGLIDILDH